MGSCKFGWDGGDVVAPVSSFTNSPDPATGVYPLTVAFTDTSTNEPTSWSWAVVGGAEGVDYAYTVGSATSQNPTIRFDIPGSYTVTLTATNTAGSEASDPETITVNYSAEAIAYFAECPTQPSAAHKRLMDTYLFKPLVAAGIFTELDRLRIFATEVEDNGLVSLVNPSSTDASKVNSPAWVQYQGYTGNGTTSYINLNYIPSSAGVKYTQNSACALYYCRTNAVGAYVDMGSSNAALANGTLLVNRFTGDAQSIRINAATATTLSANTDSRGLYMARRTASNALEGFKNGVSQGTGTVASTGLSASSFYLGAYNANGVATNLTPKQYSVSGMGSGSIDPAAFYTIIQNYMTQLGTQV